jgi:TetR/AcrR family transcriptional repressor of lmrAB and yxaGH operons
MPARPKHRDAIIKAAATLFRRRGYASTGLNDIVELSGAPKGSLYYYFPDGKASIAEAAVRFSSRNAGETLEKLAAQTSSAGALVRAYAALLAGWMEKSRFADGNAITTILLEMAPADAAVTAAGREAFRSWREIIVAKLTADGVPHGRAEPLAALAMAAIEGGLIHARVERSGAAIEQIARELEAVFAAAVG